MPETNKTTLLLSALILAGVVGLASAPLALEAAYQDRVRPTWPSRQDLAAADIRSIVGCYRIAFGTHRPLTPDFPRDWFAYFPSHLVLTDRPASLLFPGYTVLPPSRAADPRSDTPFENTWYPDGPGRLMLTLRQYWWGGVNVNVDLSAHPHTGVALFADDVGLDLIDPARGAVLVRERCQPIIHDR